MGSLAKYELEKSDGGNFRFWKIRGAIQLDLPCPKRVDGIAADPQPDWSFDALVSELNALEMKLPTFTVPFRTKTISSENEVNEVERGRAFVLHAPQYEMEDHDKVLVAAKRFNCDDLYLSENEVERGRAFVLRAPGYEMEDTESEDDHDKALVAAKRFNCDDLYLSDSDSSDIYSALELQLHLMEEAGEVEGALFELTHEHRLRVKDEIRNQISALETGLMNESEKSASALLRVEKYKESRHEKDKKFDTQYQRQM